ncbi:MAG: ArnT family glycosyltransferase [Thermoplasmatota archaeon]
MEIGERFKQLLRKEALVLGVLVVLVGTVYRLFMTFVMFLQADEEIFSYDAYFFILGRSFEFITGKIGAYIGYPMVLSVWFRIFGVSLISARFFSVLCSAVMLLFVYLTLKKIVSSPRTAFLGTLLLAVLPFPLRYGHVVLSEPMAWAMVTPGIYLLVLGSKGGKWYHFFLAGFLIGSAFFVRRSALVLLLMLFPALLWTARFDIRRIFKEAFTFLGGFLAPMVLGIFSLVIFFGWDKLVELRWTRVPNLTPEWAVDMSRNSGFDNAAFVLQPTSWVAAGMMLLLMGGLSVLLISLFKDRWKGVYASAFLWPALIRMLFEMELGKLEMARLMVLPIVAIFVSRAYKKDNGFYLSLSILLGSSVAFSNVFLSGDIWNVVIYCSVGGIVLLYLADRLQSRLLALMPLFGGMISLYLITFKEPQIAGIVIYALPVIGITYGMALPVLKEAPKGLPIVTAGLFVPMLFLAEGPSGLQWAAGLIAILFSLAILILDRWKHLWNLIRFLAPALSLCAVLFVPEGFPFWGIYLPVLGMAMFMVSSFFRLGLMERLNHFVPLTGGILGFVLIMIGTEDILLSGIGAVYVSGASVVIKNAELLSTIWREKVGEQISVILFMLVVGYLAFYVYYGWTEVYMMEFLVPAALVGGLLIWVFRDTHIKVKTQKTANGYRRTLTPLRIRRRSSVVLMALVVMSVPLSAGAFLSDDWFMEESMDKRPYMRTMDEIGDWLRDNSAEDEKILAWHCYAIEADRETILDVTNAAIYNGRLVIQEMEESGVRLFVKDWYLDHGLWENQPYFQDYILSNFVIERMVDGNECWIRVP